jgi:hypothetical protein
MKKKGSNPPSPDVFLRPQPSPAPPPKRKIIEVRHIYNTKGGIVIPFKYLDHLEKRLELILSKITKIEKLSTKKQN